MMNWSNPMKPLKRPVGRPTLFTPELGDAICNRIADGESLRAICDEADMRDKATVFRWLLAEQHKDFRNQYKRSPAAAESRAPDRLPHSKTWPNLSSAPRN